MRRDAGGVRRAIVSQMFKDVGGRQRQTRESGGPEAVVEIFVPFVPEGICRKRGDGARPECGDRGVPPETVRSHFRGHADGGRATVHRKDRAGQRVLGLRRVRS